MQTVSSRIWTRVAVFISYDDNHYTTGTAKLNCGNDFSGLPVDALVLYLFWLFKWLQITVLLRPKGFKISLWDFPTFFRAVILLSLNSDELVPLAIYVFSILSITVLCPVREWGVVEYTDGTSATSVLIMSLNNLMVRFQ